MSNLGKLLIKKAKRNKGLEELGECYSTINWLQEQVDKLPYFSKKYFYKHGQMLVDKLEDEYLWIIDPYLQIEKTNCAYEEAKKFSKLSFMNKLKKYYQ